MIPVPADIDRWIGDVAGTGARVVRTNALFPEAATVFERAGFATASELVLMSRDLRGPGSDPRHAQDASTARSTRSRRMRGRDLADASAVDAASFPDSWANDVRSLAEIRTATPHHRSRVIDGPAGGIHAFAISGRAGPMGYVQRLAVHPAARRRGLARVLLTDALRWMRRRGCATALVNTAVDNRAAIALYDSFGFRALDHRLRIMERAMPR